jgi:predicted permease
MGVPADVTAVMVVAAAMPVGVLITIFAAELEAEPECISTATVITTALSPLTVTAWIIAMRLQ